MQTTHQVSVSSCFIILPHPAMVAKHEWRALPWVCVSHRDYPCNIAFLAPLFSRLTAQLLYSPQLYHFCRVEWGKKRKRRNFIITSHFCNLYAMRTLCACSYNQVCRNHVRCFTNSWGDGAQVVAMDSHAT